MDFLSIAIILFMILETSNVIILYLKPDFKYGNSIGVFDAWEKSKENEEVHEFIKYLIYWVAGTKLIFITLLFVIVLFGSPMLKVLSVFVLILSILSFYWRLYPIIKRLDNDGHITPKGYSKTLGLMIGSFIIVFVIALVAHFL